MNTKLPTNYRLQFAASAISNVGDGMVAAAAPLLALSLTSDPRLVAGVSFASSLPGDRIAKLFGSLKAKTTR